ncbi:MAG: GbsR/MarR family transcriptional regulator, partial [Bellilinea sp.]
IGGRILGLLLVSKRPVTPEEMSDILQVSRSSISTNLRTLQMTGLADRVSLPGERSDHYVFSDDAWENSLEMRLEGILSLEEMAEDGLQGLGEGHPARERMLEVLAWSSLVKESYERLIQEWHSQKEISA